MASDRPLNAPRREKQAERFRMMKINKIVWPTDFSEPSYADDQTIA